MNRSSAHCLMGVAFAALITLVLPAELASAQDGRTIYARLPFHSETGVLPTTACLQLTERVYPTTAWWEGASGTVVEPDRTFRSVIAAIKQKDRAALLKLTDPAQARDTAEFDRQTTAFFQQFQSIRLVAVPRAYEFDGLVAFLGTFQSASQTAVVPLVFAHNSDGTFGFLPSRSRQSMLTLVTDWFGSSPSAAGGLPPYCSDADVKRATHRVSLGSGTWRPSALLLAGAPLDAPGSLAILAGQVRTTIDRMKAALGAGRIDEFVKDMTPVGGGRLKQWFATATPEERAQYTTTFVTPLPFFVFDASPLLVVYTRTAQRDVQVLFFTVASDQRLLWANSSFLTTSDPVFKRGPLFEAARESRPFASLTIR